MTHRNSTSPEAIRPEPPGISCVEIGCSVLPRLLQNLSALSNDTAFCAPAEDQPMTPWLATMYVSGPVATTSVRPAQPASKTQSKAVFTNFPIDAERHRLARQYAVRRRRISQASAS